MPHNFLEHLNSLDGFCLLVIGCSALYGLLRGFSREVMSLILWFLSALCSMRGTGFIYNQVDIHHISPLYRIGLPFFIFIIAIIILNRVMRPLSHFGRDLLSSGLDVVLGAIFGIFRGYIIIILLALFFSWSAEDWLGMSLKQSIFAPYIKMGMDFIGGGISAYFPLSLPSHYNL